LEIKFCPVVSKQNSSSLTYFSLTNLLVCVFHIVFNFLLAHTHHSFQQGKGRGRKSEERKHLLKIKGKKTPTLQLLRVYDFKIKEILC